MDDTRDDGAQFDAVMMHDGIAAGGSFGCWSFEAVPARRMNSLICAEARAI